ncbi:MAG: hypothetical protein ACLRTZ_16260 [Agathobacter sp.]
MCLSAGFTTNPADAKAELTIRYFDVAVVISMNRQASGLTTGASELSGTGGLRLHYYKNLELKDCFLLRKELS